MGLAFSKCTERAANRTADQDATKMETGKTEINDKEAMKRNKEINEKLLNDRKQDESTIKLLLLGGSESGKSTIAKQMKILHLNGFEETELINFRYIIYGNIVENMKLLLKNEKGFGSVFDEKTKKDISQYTELLKQLKETETNDEKAVYELVGRIWTSSSFQSCYLKHRDQTQLPDNLEHFMSSLTRLSAPDYTPSELDILFARTATMGVHEIRFPFRGKVFRLIDVGGQKSERRKWIHCFEHVTAIFFVAALNGYDQKLVEDNTVNRMHDSVQLFSSIINNQYFATCSAILFLNKKDVFDVKIEKIPITLCYPEYNGKTIEDAKAFLKTKFLAQVQAAVPTPEDPVPAKRSVYSHFTNATDTKNVDVVFIATADLVIKKAMGNLGVM